VYPRAGMDDVEKRNFFILPGFELRPLGRPARSQSLYRLSYPGSLTTDDRNYLRYQRSKGYIRVKFSFNVWRATLRLHFPLSNIRVETYSSYLTGNTLRLRYRAQPVNAV
jgi:hypothetical protein